MNTLTVLRLDRDRDLTADIVPEAYFKCVAVRELSYPWPASDFERQLTEIRSAWTDKFLYLHLWAKDSWITAEDKLGIVLEPPGAYLAWESTAAGIQVSYQVSEAEGREPTFNRQWKSAAQTKVRRHDAGWVWEMRIPFAKDLGDPPKRGDAWPVTFFRTDADRRGRVSLSTFSELTPDSEENFFQPGFGQIVFG